MVQISQSGSFWSTSAIEDYRVLLKMSAGLTFFLELLLYFYLYFTGKTFLNYGNHSTHYSSLE